MRCWRFLKKGNKINPHHSFLHYRHAKYWNLWTLGFRHSWLTNIQQIKYKFYQAQKCRILHKWCLKKKHPKLSLKLIVKLKFQGQVWGTQNKIFPQQLLQICIHLTLFRQAIQGWYLPDFEWNTIQFLPTAIIWPSGLPAGSFLLSRLSPVSLDEKLPNVKYRRANFNIMRLGKQRSTMARTSI